MAKKVNVVAGFRAIPRKVRAAVGGLSARELRWRGGSEGWSIREHIHHLVEANIVASTIVIAAVGQPGCRFDWSWMWPDAAWMKRLGYDKAPLEPALRLLEGLCAHVAGLASAHPKHLDRDIRLLGSVGGRLSRRTVRQMLAEEVAHVRLHLQDVADVKKAHRRPRARRRSK